MAGLSGDVAPPGRSDSDFGTSLPMPPQVHAPSHVQVQMDDDDQYTPGGYTPSARPGSGARTPRTATPLTPQEVETISKNVSGVKENLEKMTSKNPARPTTAADLQGLVSRMQQQEAEIARILNNRGFPALPPVEVAEVPAGADENMKEMYLTRGAAALGQQMEEIENRLVYDANGNLVPDGHVNSKALQPYKEPLPEKQTELMDVAEYMHQYQGMTKEEESFESEGFQEYRPKSGLSFFGILLQIMYLGACGLYIYVRVRYTLPPLSSHLAYGVIILMVEILGMISVNLFTVTLMFSSKLEPAFEQQFKRDYHVRVLIPCYKESLAIIKQTIMACLAADVPEGCKRTIYLCDDGKDPKKREWMLSMEDPSLVYVTGRKRPPGEANGKSGNLNNCLKLIYPKGLAIGYGEVMCLFDADQVCSRSFFTKMLPLIDSGDNVAISLSPQCVYNIKPGQDIFNRSNVQFWEVMLPGYDALGFISCTGTNMLIRCRALKECGWFPITTVTEDWELGMWMKKYGWICRYMPEYLAVGEAPLEVRQAFQQRSRWCKGHFQTFFSKACPAFDTKLSFPMRILYSGTVISYFSTGISVPLFSLVPIIAICWGIFPLALNFWAALGITVFYASTMIVLFNATNFRRLMALYFVQVSNYILWWTYLKGAVLTPIKIIAGKGLTFKVTNKGNKGGFDFPVRDLFMPVAISVLSTVAVVFGLVHIDLEVSAAIALSICWCVWNSIPGYLLLAYTFVGQGKTMRLLCLFSFLLSSVMSTLAIVLMWLLYPRDYDQEDLLRKSLEFMDAQRSGDIDKSIGPIWRQSAQTTLQVNVNNTIFDLSGGFYSGGYGGNSKVVSNIAYSTTMLAWAVLSYQGGFRDAGALDRALSHINQGAIYLMKSHVYNATAPGRTIFFPQAGNLTYEYRSQWERPEDLDIRLNQLAATGDFSLTAEAYPVPYFTAEDAYATGQWLKNGAGVGDLAAQMSAALTAASLAVSIEPKLASNAQMYIDRAGDLFSLSLKYPGLYTQLPWLKYDYDNAFMSSTSYKDDQTFAAAWLYRATNAAGQATTGELNNLLDLVTRLYSDAVLEWNDDGTWVSQDRILRAATIMMAIEATDRVFDSDARKFLDNFICAEEPIELTKKDRIWHPKAPYLGEDAVLAFLMAQYGDFATGVAGNHRRSYRCKAMSQLRYFIGDRGQGFIAGFGPKPPERVQHVGSTCQPFPADCPASNRFSGQPNVNKLYGALVYGQPENTDDYNDRRELKSSRVSLVNNAGLPGLVGFAVQTNLYWMECLQEGGYFSKHPMC